MPLPDCPWCHAPLLESIYIEMGVTFTVCNGCTKLSRIDPDGTAHRHEVRETPPIPESVW